ncbi:hypothetical protein ACFC09_15555 [Streptomyces sp. NPDC056161]|uniref:hypothetical protein n=1 Tax=Streptomyces sp. NPDC056161 TaxID=3345732 RepID=UPI0035DA4E6D
MRVNTIITVQPARHLRVPFARWAVAQRPKVRTVSHSAFGVPPHLFTDMPEDLLRGSLVDGRAYVAVEGEPTPPAPQGAPELTGVATVDGLREAAPGQPLPEVPPSLYGPDSAPLPPPDFAPLEDAPTFEAGELHTLEDTGDIVGDTSGDPRPGREDTAGPVPAATSGDTHADTGDTAGDSDSSDPAAKPHPCPACPRSFDSPRGVEIHARRAHREV